MNQPYGKPDEPGMPIWVQMLLWVGGIGVISVALLFAIGLFIGDGKPIDPSAEQKACIVTRGALEEYFDFESVGGEESWAGTDFFGQIWQIEYDYSAPDDDPFQVLAILSKGVGMGEIYQELLAVRVEENGEFSDGVSAEKDGVPFFWGDESAFFWQLLDGERYGFIYVARTKDRVYFLDVWGLELDDSQELTDLVLPRLKRFEEL